jgi:hypothetical protein
VLSIDGDSATVCVFIANGAIRSKSVATSMLPAEAAVGHPVACELSDTSNPDTSTVLQTVGTIWGGNEPPDEMAAAGDDGVFPVLPRGTVVREPLEWWREA